MFLNSFNLALRNLTTIESLDKRYRTYFLAISISVDTLRRAEQSQIHTVTYPFLPRDSAGNGSARREKTSRAILHEPRTFAIVETKPGDNPWDLGFSANVRSVMGDSWYDWLLPLKYSPSCDHHNDISEFPYGNVVERLKKENGLVPADLSSRINRERQI